METILILEFSYPYVLFACALLNLTYLAAVKTSKSACVRKQLSLALIRFGDGLDQLVSE